MDFAERLESRGGTTGRGDQGGHIDAEVDEATQEQLEALGYLE